MTTNTWQPQLRDLMAGNGVLMIFASLVGGLGLWMYVLGGFELLPGVFIEFQLPGSERGWTAADIFSFLALFPAYVFGVLNMIALVAIGRQAILEAKARRAGQASAAEMQAA
ncbi:hypothetical protein [Tropicibacter naphthalenivorans]|uniref:Uncharacterized protein n=1 Tax=Tropicibacter naphthalenivorans TaxID=441103 RepID=A0A0P1GXD6_9RHOB|nr:hypothetical protein [Tropicibacter naphthalenivorans]CUH81220.1 hypothetical protein TRN7648_03372 [Tropicibacter naphthalenivorans]SMC97767.1 hypothetical protein SAMN04488093_10876 [Tropicibacter naphthalenivorans]